MYMISDFHVVMSQVVSDLQCKNHVDDLAAASDHPSTIINADIRTNLSKAQQVTSPDIGN
jgi:hypothetical protein